MYPKKKTVHKSVYSVTNERDLMFNLSQHIKVMLMFHAPVWSWKCVDKLLPTCVHVFVSNVWLWIEFTSECTVSCFITDPYLFLFHSPLVLGKYSNHLNIGRIVYLFLSFRGLVFGVDKLINNCSASVLFHYHFYRPHILSQCEINCLSGRSILMRFSETRAAFRSPAVFH